MSLSQQDNLRLNVLLAQQLHAVRIDESRMIVHALSDKGEAKVKLNPTGRDEPYLRIVKQLLSTQVLGSPGGYPVYLKRWTRMGQARDESLERLLLLGEPEAVVAVVHAAGLTDELARRAWWAAPTAENARRMLERECVAKGRMGPVLAEALVEFLPFEEEHQDMIDTIRLVLQPGLINDQLRNDLWARCKRRNTFYVGFLQAIPDALPAETSAYPYWQTLQPGLQDLIDTDNPFAVLLGRVFSAEGQAFLDTAETVLRKPTNQDVVVALMEVIGEYFRLIRCDECKRRNIDDVFTVADHLCESPDGQPTALAEVLKAQPDTRKYLRAMLILSMAGEQLVAPIFGMSDAIGSVMRKRLEPVTTPMLEQFDILRKT